MSWNIIKMKHITFTYPYGGAIFDDWIELVMSWDIIKMKPIIITYPYVETVFDN